MYATRTLGATLVLVALAAAVGCKREEQPAPPTSPPQPQAQQAPAAQPQEQAPVTLTPAPPASAIPTTGPAAVAAGAAQMTATEARAMLDQAIKYINENKFDLADKALSQVEAHKASLPGSIQGQISGVRKMLEARTMMNQTQQKLPASLPSLGMPNK